MIVPPVSPEYFVYLRRLTRIREAHSSARKAGNMALAEFWDRVAWAIRSIFQPGRIALPEDVGNEGGPT